MHDANSNTIYITHVNISSCIYLHNLNRTTCYEISQSITPKISSLGLIIKHIFLKKYFVNTIHVNSKTLGLLFMANHQHRFHVVKPNFIAISGPIHIIIQFISQIKTQTLKTTHKTVTDCTIGFHNFLQIWSQVLGPIKRPFKASTQPKHQQSS